MEEAQIISLEQSRFNVPAIEALTFETDLVQSGVNNTLSKRSG
jgi:hypothetical protein